MPDWIDRSCRRQFARLPACLEATAISMASFTRNQQNSLEYLQETGFKLNLFQHQNLKGNKHQQQAVNQRASSSFGPTTLDEQEIQPTGDSQGESFHHLFFSKFKNVAPASHPDEQVIDVLEQQVEETDDEPVRKQN